MSLKPDGVVQAKGESDAAALPSANRPVRFTYLAVMPAPYMMDLFEAVRADGRISLKVLFLEKPAVAAPGVYWQERDLPAYANVLPGRWYSISGARVHVNRGLFRAFKESRPDLVVVLGYSSLTCQLAMYWLSFKRIPWVFWGEIPGFERRGVFGRLMRRVALFPVARLSRGIAAIGSRAMVAYAKLAGSSKPTANIPYFCRNRELLQIQRDPESDPTPRFLYCGQMVVRKGVDLLIQAFCKVARAFPEATLTMVGDGPLRSQLENEVPAELRSRVRWEGFREPEELPRYFAVCNVFVLPSLHDGWGVVINQAVSAGMAVIVSDAVGAGVDLVVDRVNGLIVESNSGPALENALSYFAQNPQVIGQYGQESRRQGERMTPEAGAERWHEFAMQVLGGNRAR